MVKNNAFLIFINMKLISERLCSLKEERKEVRFGETHLYISGGRRAPPLFVISLRGFYLQYGE